MKKTIKKGNTKFWSMIWGLGLAGQLCWNIENQWFNTFVYSKIAKNSNIITIMVISSALVTTISTFVFGTLSDRIGNRKKFVSIGYIVWGVFTIAFGLTEFITSGTVGNGAKTSIIAAVLVILADDFMSFFGSMGYDSGYNAWINDMMTDENSGQIGAVIALQPVIGTIVGTLLGGFLIGSNDNYQRLFWTMGIFVIIMGILSLVFMDESKNLKPNRTGTYLQQLSSIFNFKEFVKHKELLLSGLTATFFYIPFNIYFVHMGNWMIYHLGFSPEAMGIIQGVGLILSMTLVFPAITLINKKKTPVVALWAVISNLIGLLVIFFTVRPNSVNPENVFSSTNIFLFIGMLFAGASIILMAQAMGVWVKELYPEDQRGQFEGVRIVFFVLLPMLIGTVLGNIIIHSSKGTVVNEFGITENIPTESVFFWAAILVVFTVIPLFFASKKYYKRNKKHAEIKG